MGGFFMPPVFGPGFGSGCEVASVTAAAVLLVAAEFPGLTEERRFREGADSGVGALGLRARCGAACLVAGRLGVVVASVSLVFTFVFLKVGIES